METLSTNFRNNKVAESVTLRGAGTGTIRGISNIILKGSVTAALVLQFEV